MKGVILTKIVRFFREDFVRFFREDLTRFIKNNIILTAILILFVFETIWLLGFFIYWMKVKKRKTNKKKEKEIKIEEY